MMIRLIRWTTCLILSLAAAVAKAQSGPTDAASLGLTELTDDMSRQQLFAQIQATDRQGSPADVATYRR